MKKKAEEEREEKDLTGHGEYNPFGVNTKLNESEPGEEHPERGATGDQGTKSVKSENEQFGGSSGGVSDNRDVGSTSSIEISTPAGTDLMTLLMKFNDRLDRIEKERKEAAAEVQAKDNDMKAMQEKHAAEIAALKEQAERQAEELEDARRAQAKSKQKLNTLKAQMRDSAEAETASDMSAADHSQYTRNGASVGPTEDKDDGGGTDDRDSTFGGSTYTSMGNYFDNLDDLEHAKLVSRLEDAVKHSTSDIDASSAESVASKLTSETQWLHESSLFLGMFARAKLPLLLERGPTQAISVLRLAAMCARRAAGATKGVSEQMGHYLAEVGSRIQTVLEMYDAGDLSDIEVVQQLDDETKGSAVVKTTCSVLNERLSSALEASAIALRNLAVLNDLLDDSRKGGIIPHKSMGFDRRGEWHSDSKLWTILDRMNVVGDVDSEGRLNDKKVYLEEIRILTVVSEGAEAGSVFQALQFVVSMVAETHSDMANCNKATGSDVGAPRLDAARQVWEQVISRLTTIGAGDIGTSQLAIEIERVARVYDDEVDKGNLSTMNEKVAYIQQKIKSADRKYGSSAVRAQQWQVLPGSVLDNDIFRVVAKQHKVQGREKRTIMKGIGGDASLSAHGAFVPVDQRRCYNCDKVGHLASNCPEGRRGGRGGRGGGRHAGRQGGRGRGRQQQAVRLPGNGNPPPPGTVFHAGKDGRTNREVDCTRCWLWGHEKDNCPKSYEEAAESRRAVDAARAGRYEANAATVDGGVEESKGSE